jgi:ATP-dependent DNA ligase
MVSAETERRRKSPSIAGSLAVSGKSSGSLYAFDLLELDGTDLRREPIEVRKATLASILRKSRPRSAVE